MYKVNKLFSMRVFEFYFNPKLKTDLVFDSFCYEPENIYERRVGSLYMVGAIKNALPKSPRLLDELSKTIKERYYTPIVRSPEKTLKESLKRANNFLENLVQKGDVSWLGNLNFVTLTIQKAEFNLSKVGDIKTFLIRKKRVVDIEKKIRFEDIEPYPLKIFLNIVSGKLSEEDVIVILSKEVADFFEKEAILDDLTKIYPLDEKKIINLFNSKKTRFQELSGVCLIIIYKNESFKNRKRNILVQPKTQDFSLKKALAPILKIKLPKIKLLLPKIASLNYKLLIKSSNKEKEKKPEKILKISKPLKKKKSIKIPKISIPKFTLPKINLKYWKEKIQVFLKHKNAILILGLIIFLFLGSLVFQRETTQQLKSYQNQLSQIQKQIDLADSLLILNKSQSTQEAQNIFQKAWEDLDIIIKDESILPISFQNKVNTIRNEILDNLSQISKLEKIENPEIIFEFENKEFVPQKMILKQNDIYFLSSESKGIFKLKEDGNNQLLESNQEFSSAAVWGNSIIFFSEPNQIISFQEGQLSQSFSLEIPYPDFNFNDLEIFNSNLYFLENKKNQIIKYSYLEDFKWDLPQLWISEQTQKPIEPTSLAIDGSAWILNQNNISKYSIGLFKENIGTNIFPAIQNPLKIFTNKTLPYLYILEPVQNRIIILDKAGQIIKQFQSQKFDNFLDFAVSDNGKTIWILNNLTVYQIKL
ncbi:MAG: hypothetical protein ABH876_00405 [Patescibacteria group bacterium]